MSSRRSARKRQQRHPPDMTSDGEVRLLAEGEASVDSRVHAVILPSVVFESEKISDASPMEPCSDPLQSLSEASPTSASAPAPLALGCLPLKVESPGPVDGIVSERHPTAAENSNPVSRKLAKVEHEQLSLRHREEIKTSLQKLRRTAQDWLQGCVIESGNGKRDMGPCQSQVYGAATACAGISVASALMFLYRGGFGDSEKEQCQTLQGCIRQGAQLWTSASKTTTGSQNLFTFSDMVRVAQTTVSEEDKRTKKQDGLYTEDEEIRGLYTEQEIYGRATANSVDNFNLTRSIGEVSAEGSAMCPVECAHAILQAASSSKANRVAVGLCANNKCVSVLVSRAESKAESNAAYTIYVFDSHSSTSNGNASLWQLQSTEELVKYIYSMASSSSQSSTGEFDAQICSLRDCGKELLCISSTGLVHQVATSPERQFAASIKFPHLRTVKAEQAQFGAVETQGDTRSKTLSQAQDQSDVLFHKKSTAQKQYNWPRQSTRTQFGRLSRPPVQVVDRRKDNDNKATEIKPLLIESGYL